MKAKEESDLIAVLNSYASLAFNRLKVSEFLCSCLEKNHDAASCLLELTSVLSTGAADRVVCPPLHSKESMCFMHVVGVQVSTGKHTV